MPPTVRRPSSTLCAPSHMIAAVPQAVPRPISTLNFRPTTTEATAASTTSSVARAKARSPAGSWLNACTAGSADSDRSITS